jgi:glycosyltransferase involved in cell wall biosynthesis
MKILHIITSLRVGGAEVALLNRLKAMRNDFGYQHKVICFYDGPIAGEIRELGISVVLVRGLVKGYDPVGLWKLFKIALTFKPDIIHTALWAANMVGRIVGPILQITVINELHGNVAHEGWLRNVAERWLLRGASRVVAVSPSVRHVYERHIVQALPLRDRSFIATRLVTIPNGIDRSVLVARVSAQLLSREALGLTQSDFVVGAIGRFERIKSYDVLVRSVARLCELVSPEQRNSIKLCLVGDGSERGALERLLQELDLEQHVVFTGYRLDAFNFYPLFDCFALSSQSEGLSIALLEALALGLPVISTHLELQHDAIVPGVNGLLIPVNDVEHYAQGLLALYNKQIKKSGDLSPLSHFPFSIDVVVDAYRLIYQQLILRAK